MNPDIQKIREKYGITPIKKPEAGKKTPIENLEFLRGTKLSQLETAQINAGETRKNIGEAFKKRASNIIERVKSAAKGITEYENPNIAGIDKNLVDGETRKAGSVANAIAQTGSAVAGGIGELGAGVGDLFIELFKGAAKSSGLIESQPVKDLKKLFAPEKMTPEFRQLLSTLGEKAKENPEVARALEDTLNSTGLLVPGASRLAAQPVKDAITTATESAIQGVKGIVEPVAQSVSSGIEKRAAQSAFNEALDVIKPSLTSAEKEAALKQGRVKTSGITRKTEVTPDVLDQRVADAVSPLVSDGRVSAKALAEDNISAISEEVSRLNSGVKNFIDDNKIPFNSKQLRSKLNAVKDENKLIFASDPTIEKTFNSLVSEFMSHVSKMDTSGLFEARQTFDQLPAIKKLLENEKIGENVRRELVRDIRRAANDYVSELLPENNPYKAILKNETYLLRAIDNIAGANAGKIDTNAIQRLFKKYPWLKTAVGVGIGAGGVQFVSN